MTEGDHGLGAQMLGTLGLGLGGHPGTQRGPVVATDCLPGVGSTWERPQAGRNDRPAYSKQPSDSSPEGWTQGSCVLDRQDE